MLPALTVRTACPILKLLSFELLENPAAVADGLVLYSMYTKHHQGTSSRKGDMGQNSSQTPAVSLVLTAEFQSRK
jgi:hypothetical protein